MAVMFRKAVTENVSLIIGLAGGTGSGKSFSGMRLASGIAGDKPFAVIDSENRRALHYAGQFKFDHADLRPPFRPDVYADTITSADAAGYPVIVVDQFSYEHAGEGGLLDWQEEELTRMAGEDWKKREACKMASWIKPKLAHKHMMQKLLMVRAHLILLFRAEQKIEMVKDNGGKWIIQPKQSVVGVGGWIPIAEKTLPYELTASFLLTADAPGVPKPIKLQEQHRALFPLDRPITEAAGRALAEWAKGNAAKAPAVDKVADSQGSPVDKSSVSQSSPASFISPKQAADLEAYCLEHRIPLAAVLKAANVTSAEQLPSFERAKAYVDKQIAARNAEANEAAARG